MTAWLPNHTEAQTMPTLLAAIAGLKQEGFTEFTATGYCFGGNYHILYMILKITSF